MELFLRNLPANTSETELSEFFEPLLRQFGLDSYRCNILKGKGLATLTVADKGAGEAFLKTYCHHQRKIPLILKGQMLNCSKSTNQPNNWKIEALKKQQKERLRDGFKPQAGRSHESKSPRKFYFTNLECGLWDYEKGRLAFFPEYQDHRPGTIEFCPKDITISILESRKPTTRINIALGTITNICIDDHSEISIVLALAEAPKIYESLEDDLANLVKSLGISFPTTKGPNWKRIAHLGASHSQVISTCLVYRLVLLNSSAFRHIFALRNEIPTIIPFANLLGRSLIPHSDAMAALGTDLAKKYTQLPFQLKFLLQRLASNAILTPARVVALIPRILDILKKHGGVIAAESLKKLIRRIPYAGPYTEAKSLEIKTLLTSLEESKDLALNSPFSEFDKRSQYDHMGLVYKATVTPSGIYYYGPDYEVKNRILRKYSDYLSCFLRVSFLEENGGSIFFDSDASQDYIFSTRFRDLLGGFINIAGNGYQFLGFSHSSLRSSTCWFMSPFILNERLMWSESVIADLGDFTNIRIPAKCAARIGQAFSETFSAVPIPEGAMRVIEDVKFENRVFSDGVGTLSLELMKKLWKGGVRNKSSISPTLFQIRFAGAKGMISYDSRLTGETLLLRPSMIKFEGSKARDIEICGAAYRPLPMFLNRQLIKILEDLGIDGAVFEQLQESAVEKLRMTTLSGVNAAYFLEKNGIGGSARLPALLRALDRLGFSFQADEFLRHTTEMATLISLREIKYRSRILVEKGVTLYGIMDETGYLEEGKVFCKTFSEPEGNRVLTGEVLITRCPALHPGDVQKVAAVDVPADSPLHQLFNCIVFSQKGKRDLPSMLSGGDLDGDLYNIIYDERFLPTVFYSPADYPRATPIDIGRPVERKDMYEFFLKFMESDQLGRIATLHQVIADQSHYGTRDERCLILADMHSTAVDFSKTGIPIDHKRLPKHDNLRPDFMANGPRIDIVRGVSFEELSSQQNPYLEGENRVSRYYESQKILGVLYRAIDEREIFESIRKTTALSAARESRGILRPVWEYVLEKAQGIQWANYIEWATGIKELYDEDLLDIMNQYSIHFTRPLNELEVVVGCIIGKYGRQTKRQREESIAMKDKYEDLVSYVNKCIARGPGGEEEMLPRSMACFYLGLQEDEKPEKFKIGIRSYAWVAGATCLKSLDSFINVYPFTTWS
ncbi:MAG: hypothetical protein M1829_005349 [Trizodia sp. TS-e1964]|nr:MAG: hypothetical protein M1829_005349 [Trizodia sp. TS-e1964]